LPSEWLFSVALEPVLIIDAGSRCIVQANPAAAELLQHPQAALVGIPLVRLFDESSTGIIEDSLNKAQGAGDAEEVTCRAAGGGPELRAKLSLFRSGAESFVLVRLAAEADEAWKSRSQSPVFDAIEGASVGFLLTDSGLRIEYANQAFIDMIELPPPVEMRGKSLVQWLQLTADDLARLRDQMLQREATSVMTARLRTERDSPLEVEVCAVAVPDGAHTCWGFTIRELPRLN
jgi:PAS domain-containing protein